MFSIGTEPFYIPTSDVRGFQFLHILSNNGYFVFVAVFLIMVILVVVKWYSTVVLIYIFLMTSNSEHFFMCLLTIYLSSVEKCLFTSFEAFNWFFVFLLLENIYSFLTLFWSASVCFIQHSFRILATM